MQADRARPLYRRSGPTVLFRNRGYPQRWLSATVLSDTRAVRIRAACNHAVPIRASATRDDRSRSRPAAAG
ncbi:hypothetical protein GALLR39Z86_21930 [Glycomyces algeriensis]|uniref:Uncharacterized protein n=1 Tax=Glycomyces algeriensis TaxID=256037 RepID=A0A9W6LG82_9ACTN|nr:hypothetical protein GALLR39Z86_21930 [Glycomyces algeriensis]